MNQIEALRRLRRLGTAAISFHRLPAELFLGFDVEADGSKVATAKKPCSIRCIWPPRAAACARLPELAIPREFRWRRLSEFAALVKFARRRVHIERRIEQLERLEKS